MADFFNLLEEKWIPVYRHSGKKDIISPLQIIEKDDPVMDLDWARPDFQVGCYVFLIGLLATAFPPKDIDEWCNYWEENPDIEELKKAFLNIKDAFWLDRDEGGCFMQDISGLSDIESTGIESLLMSDQGKQATKNNTDLFIHHQDNIEFSLSEAAIGIFALQSWAPAGGRGYRVGLGGSAPMVTLIIPEKTDLWHLLWSNVPYGEAVKEADPKVFPWMAKEGTYYKAKDKNYLPVILGEQVDVRQCWWGMPWPVKLDILRKEKKVKTLKKTQYGINYENCVGVLYDTEIHVPPLTPTRREGNDWTVLKVRSDNLNYHLWAGVISPSNNDKYHSYPAGNLTLWRKRNDDIGGIEAHLFAAGYEMEPGKAKTISFIESEMPLPSVYLDEDQREKIDDFGKACIKASDECLSKLSISLRNISNNAGTKSTYNNDIKKTFISRTEDTFFRILNDFTEAISKKKDIGRRYEQSWYNFLRKTVFSIFDEMVVINPLEDIEKIKLVFEQKRQLKNLFSNTKSGKKLKESLHLSKL